MASEKAPTIKVKTTMPSYPFPGNSERAPIRTARLLIRPLTQDDLPALHSLRTQREVMSCLSRGQVDQDLAETQAKLDPFLPPGDAQTYNPGIFLAATGELIGLGGVFAVDFQLGWPEVGYMIRAEHWGRGYTTEFLEAFVQAWFALPRSDVEADVDARSVGDAREGDVVPEMLSATVEAVNARSLRVVEKAGFRKFGSWTVPSRKVGNEGAEITIVGFVTTGPGKTA
ncbi:acyl-CoA N-acyltransferase [Xylaria sp. FL1777]|nr:acyl-CoA N-acyltransferase [Xylaria sp. FL1777]